MAVEPGIQLIEPSRLQPNPENPRLIFRQDELQLLQDSIQHQGILVPLTVYRDGRSYVILDGERRWRCALKLGLDRIPAIVQPKPDPLQNLMMMFAIHNQRRDWDPLPTAYKLRDLEEKLTEDWERVPTEAELAELASITRGEVRRYKQLLNLPEQYRDELMEELEKPRQDQILTVDHVLEATRGAAALQKRAIIDHDEEEELRRAVVDKFKTRVIKNTVEPRLLARMARAVERGEVSSTAARKTALRVIREPAYGLEQAFMDSSAEADFAHGTEQLVQRLRNRLDEHEEQGFEPTPSLRAELEDLLRIVRSFLSR